jgi:hypothetical protein
MLFWVKELFTNELLSLLTYVLLIKGPVMVVMLVELLVVVVF